MTPFFIPNIYNKTFKMTDRILIGINGTTDTQSCGGYVEGGKVKVNSLDNVSDYLANKIVDSEQIQVVTSSVIQQDGATYYTLKLMFSDEIWDLLTTKISGGTASGTTIVGGDSDVEYDSIQLRGDTEANWISINPVLKINEPVVVFMTDGSVRLKIGDGVTSFVNLNYLSNGSQEQIAVDKELVPVSIYGVWSDTSGTTLSTSSEFNSIEKGASITWVGHFKWIHDSLKKDPTKILEESDFYGFTLPASNEFSPNLTITGITEDLTISADIAAPKIGYEVINGKLVVAYGDDISSSSVSIDFKDRIFFGKVTTNIINSAVISDLKSRGVSGTELTNTINKTITGITTSNTEYFTFCYPRDKGLLTTIIQNGGIGVLEAFNMSEITVLNQWGTSIQLYCYTSRYRGAFSGASLKFVI